MKRTVLSSLFFILFFVVTGFAQNPVTWSLLSDAKGKPAENLKFFKVRLSAAIEAPWHLYAVEQPEGGPIPTTITSAMPELFSIDGKITSPPPVKKFDENFKIETKFFLKEAVFDFNVKSLAASNVDDFAVNVRYQVCNETTCLPPKTVKVTFTGFEDVKRSAISSQQSVRNHHHLFLMLRRLLPITKPRPIFGRLYGLRFRWERCRCLRLACFR